MAHFDHRSAEALGLAERLLDEIELSAISPTDAVRKASRLTRLLDDIEAMEWLSYEVGGYPDEGNGLPAKAVVAAERSGRRVPDGDLPKGTSGPAYRTESLGRLSIAGEAAAAVIQNPSSKPFERTQSRNDAVQVQDAIDSVIGSVHGYVAETYQAMRFGSAVESAFEVVRREVDSAIGTLVPDALPMLSAAFENVTSENPEDWANGAATCRRLLKAAADELRPPGPSVEGRAMGDSNYVNRIVDWIVNNSASETAAKFITSDLAYLGQRLDAVDGAGHKGAHATVDRFDASRFVTGTYLLLGDILSLSKKVP